MAAKSNTKFKSSDLASDYHRILGLPCCFCDIDLTESEDGSMTGINTEYTYDYGRLRTVAIIDWKYPGQSLSDKYSAIKQQINLSDNELKVPVPFFIVVYYLDEQHPVKCYYVIPANKTARSLFDQYGFSHAGKWFSLKHFSIFQHKIRQKVWDKNEPINNDNLQKIGMERGMTLGDLSSEILEYKLPLMDFSWLGGSR